MDRKTLEFNGACFEAQISRMLARLYPDGRILADVHLPCKFLNKEETQIDLILVHPRGVFVIEAKGWKNWVKGGYTDSVWKGAGSAQNILAVYSPVSQNIIHIRALRNAIRKQCDFNPISFTNLVCFPDGVRNMSVCDEVVNFSNLKLKIDKQILRQDNLINVNDYVNLINQVRI